MNKLTKLSLAIAVSVFAVGCTRIETGEVGVRVGFDKQVNDEDVFGTEGWEHWLGLN